VALAAVEQRASSTWMRCSSAHSTDTAASSATPGDMPPRSPKCFRKAAYVWLARVSLRFARRSSRESSRRGSSPSSPCAAP
jgi:hypothetical protein